MLDLIDMKNFTASIGIQWTPPGAPDNTGNSTLSVQGTENAQSVGELDVPSSTTVGTELAVPFGTVDAAKLLVIKNSLSAEVGVKLNGSLTANFTLGPGQIMAIAGPTAGTGTPLTSASVTTTAAPTATEQVQYWVMGD